MAHLKGLARPWPRGVVRPEHRAMSRPHLPALSTPAGARPPGTRPPRPRIPLVAAIDAQCSWVAQTMGGVASHGLRHETPRGSKCLVLRVAMVIPAASATAAMMASSKGACSGTR